MCPRNPQCTIQEHVAERAFLLQADEAMNQFADGDEAAFAIVYDHLEPSLRRLLWRCPEQERDDIIQETFLRIAGARGKFRRGRPVRPWAWSIALRLSMDAWEHQRPLLVDDEIWVAAIARLRDEVTPEDQARANVAIAQVIDAYRALTPKRQRVIDLVLINGMSHQHAAEILGTTSGAIDGLLFQARHCIMQALLGGHQ